MQNNPNNLTLAQHFNTLGFKADSKYDEETLDEAIINGLKGENRDFCRRIETFLNNFMKGPKNVEQITEINKYQRKIVHKICDLYNITREYVDIKSDELGTITITKSEKSVIPSTSLEERYKKHLEKSKKTGPGQSNNPFSNKKVLVKTRVAQPVKKEVSDKSENSDSNPSQTQQTSAVDSHEEYESKKKKDYEEARDRILQETEQKEKETKQNINLGVKQKKGKRYDKSYYDPDFDRARDQFEMGDFVDPIGFYDTMDQMNGPPGMGYYPMYGHSNYMAYQGYGGSNANAYPQSYGNSSSYPSSYGYQYPNVNIQTKPTTSGNYFQNFPNLDRNVNFKK